LPAASHSGAYDDVDTRWGANYDAANESDYVNMLEHAAHTPGGWRSRAEALIALERPQAARDAFTPQASSTEAELRIGIWR